MSGLAVFHRDHARFLAEALSAHDAGVPLFLGNPDWGPAELDEAARLIPKGVEVVGADLVPRGMGPCDWHLGWRSRLMIPSGGSGGRVKLVIQEPRTLRASALALRDALSAHGLSPVLHGASLTPPWHVSGLMPVIRARETGGKFAVLDGRFRAEDPLPSIGLPEGGTRIASLVATQLSRLLQRTDGEAWLRRFDVVLLGGSRVPAEILSEIRTRRLPVFLTYGMTETAAACALCPPELIWGGEEPRGIPLPGVRFEEKDGVITVNAPSLAVGVWPDQPFAVPHPTGDRGTVLADGSVRITGRADAIIVTGGEKVDPERVEQVLLSTGVARAAKVFSIPDARWGETVVACVEGPAAAETALRGLAETLEPAARPKRYAFVAKLPLDARGKFDRVAALKALGR